MPHGSYGPGGVASSPGCFPETAWYQLIVAGAVEIRGDRILTAHFGQYTICNKHRYLVYITLYVYPWTLCPYTLTCADTYCEQLKPGSQFAILYSLGTRGAKLRECPFGERC